MPDTAQQITDHWNHIESTRNQLRSLHLSGTISFVRLRLQVFDLRSTTAGWLLCNTLHAFWFGPVNDRDSEKTIKTQGLYNKNPNARVEFVVWKCLRCCVSFVGWIIVLIIWNKWKTKPMRISKHILICPKYEVYRYNKTNNCLY